jgi:GGDEF domain-containing protein/tetratricopeptide (TPR) repeat protein
MVVGELDEFDAFAKRAGSRAADAVAGQVGRLFVSLLRGDDVVLTQPNGRFLLLLPGNTGDEGRQVGERLATAVRTYGLAAADRQVVDRLTASFGSAAFPDHGTTSGDLFAAASAACARIASQGGDGASLAPLPHHEVLHRPLSIDRFAGRVAELTSLVRFVDDAVARRPRVVGIIGDSGLGTATLLRQLEPHVRYRGGAMITAASPASPVPEPYAVWTSVLRGLQRYPDAPQQEWRELQKLVPSLGERQRVEAAGSQYRLLEELSAYITESANTRPIVLVLDEMQRADDSSWEAIEHLMGKLDSDRILIFITCRSEREFADAADRRQVLKRHQIYQELVLGRLTRDEVKQWLSAAFHKQEIGREFLAFLYRHTEGNPFFLSQLVSALVEQGALWHSGQRWEWSPVSELRLPSGIDSLIAQRISRFSANSQEILRTAAILGRDFDVRLVADAGGGSEPAVRLAMSEGVAAGLVRPKSERKAGGYGFTHDQISGVLLDGLSREAIRDLHRRMAHALVGRGDRPAGEIAVHYHEAQSTGLAYEYARKAAVEAENLHAIAAARAYLEIAMQNAASPAELADVRVQLAHLSEIVGRYDEVEELCDLVIEWFEGQREVRRALGARRMRERARLEQGQSARVSISALEELLEKAHDLGIDEEAVAISTLASTAYGRVGEGRKAERLAMEAVEMAEQLARPALLADALTRLAVVLMHDSPVKGQAMVVKALDIFESLGDIRGQARAQNMIAIFAQLEGHTTDAHAAFEKAASMAKLAGMPDLRGVASLNLATLIQKSGDYGRAREMFADSMTSFAQVKNSAHQVIALFNMAHCEREQELWQSAIELYGTTSELAERIGHGDVEIGARAGAGLCYLELGRLDEARAAEEEVRLRLERRPEWFQNREIAEALIIRFLAMEKRGDTAFARLEWAINTAGPGDSYVIVWLTLACIRELAELDGPRALGHMQRIQKKVEEMGYSEISSRFNQLSTRVSAPVG